MGTFKKKKKKDINSAASSDTDRDSDRWVKADDLFSDESSFYGDDEAKEELEARAAAYDPREYWDTTQWDIQRRAARGQQQQQHGTKRKRNTTPPTSSPPSANPPPSTTTTATTITTTITTTRPYNPWEGDPCAKQLTETLSAFLTRLPPSTTTSTSIGPWIRVSNPHSATRPLSSNLGEFKQEGTRALDKYLTQKTKVETQNPTKPAGAITRMLRAEREYLTERIVSLARRFGVTSGKWMLFPTVAELDAVWRVVATAVLEGELGPSAKVGTDHGDPDSGKARRLVCVYTADFADVGDVKRVLTRIRQLGLTSDSAGKEFTIYYKCDAYTHLDISNGNEYKIKTSMYNTEDMGE